MRKSFLTILLCALASICSAQTKALTENGDEVVLYDDGTWLYVNDSLNWLYDEEELAVNLETNPNQFSKPKDAKFELKSKVMDISFWFDSNLWKSSKLSVNDDAEYQFETKDTEIYAIVITERIEIPLETLRTVSLQHIRDAAKNVEILEEEYRIVNGKQVISTRVNALVEGIKISYHIYYYADESGSMQFMVYTSQNLYPRRKGDMENLLNGLVVAKK